MYHSTKHSYNRGRRKSALPVFIIVSFLLLLIILAVCAWFYLQSESGNFHLPWEKETIAYETEPASTDSSETSAIAAESETEDSESKESSGDDMTEAEAETQTSGEETANSAETTTAVPTTTFALTGDDLLNEANRNAAMYDYDKAIAMLENSADYSSSEEYKQAVADYNQKKSELKKWADNSKITHIFFHSLIWDTSLAFDGSTKAGQYNQVMTTVDEFKAILNEMYNRGFVLVSIYDIAKMEPQADGSSIMTKQAIYLPEGKEPFVLSQDDLSYYEYMTGDGFANRLVVQEDGTVTCEMDKEDGSKVRGSFDVVPILEDFIKEHPDFCYRGARGTIALTGYNGVFGYRTSNYSYGADSQNNTDFVYVNPNIEADRAAAKQVADALKNMGWTFATHSWGHKSMKEISYDHFVWDINLWMEEVVPIIGPTDICIYPKGDDIGSWRGYSSDPSSAQYNEKYVYLKSLGFNYFCNVDSSQYWVQFTNAYMRMGRRNVDGQRMYEVVSGQRDLLSDLFDAKEIFDQRRPVPVQ